MSALTYSARIASKGPCVTAVECKKCCKPSQVNENKSTSKTLSTCVCWRAEYVVLAAYKHEVCVLCTHRWS